MKKKNGFTLVELLAVIVVLAIIMVIAIPNVLDAMNKSKKESFYLYAQKLYSTVLEKYTSNMAGSNGEGLNCVVYDIKEDLKLSTTGSYDGWVRIERIPTSSGKSNVSITINAPKELQNVKQCIGISSCNPDKTYRVSKGAKSLTLSNVLTEGQTFCVSYQTENEDGTLGTPNTKCANYGDGTPFYDDYQYQVSVTLTDRTYSIENAIMNDDMFEEKFFGLMDEFKKSHDSLAINKPSCIGDDIEIKGTTTRGITQISNSTESTSSNTVNSSSNIASSKTMISNEKSTSYIEQTTPQVQTDNLRLEDLNVEGYKINFSPTIYYYNITVSNDVTALKVTATPKNSDSKVTISGQNGLAVGDNQIVVEVSDVTSGKHAFYRIFVKRLRDNNTTVPTTTEKDPNVGKPDSKLDESNASLKNLRVNGYTLKFNQEEYEYTLVTRGENEIFVTAIPEQKDASVLITGTKDLEKGGEVVIKVTSKNGFYEKTYKIKIETENDDSSAKTYQMIVIGLAALLSIVVIVLGLTRKNRKVVDYTGTTDATSGPGVTNGQLNNQNPQMMNSNSNGLPQPQPIPRPTNTIVQPQPVVFPNQVQNNPSVQPTTPIQQNQQQNGQQASNQNNSLEK